MSPRCRRIVDRRNNFDTGRVGTHFKTQTAEFARGAFLKFVERVFIKVGRMRIKPLKHSGDSFFHELFILNGINVVLLYRTVDISELSDFIERKNRSGCPLRSCERGTDKCSGNHASGHQKQTAYAIFHNF